MSSVVLDASALLALLAREPGWEVVAATIPGAVISAVNLSEVVAKLADRTVPGDAIRAAIEGLGIEVAPFESELAYAAGLLRPLTRGHGLAFGDRACLALARQRDSVAVTADRLWLRLDLGVEVRCLRE